jgi:hypothetical protein
VRPAEPTSAATPAVRPPTGGSCTAAATTPRRSRRSDGPTSGATPTVHTSSVPCSIGGKTSRARCRRSASAAERGHAGAAEVAKMLREEALAGPSSTSAPTATPPASPAWAALRDDLVRVGARDLIGTALV